jgi:CheY-like chemotaxis protein
VSRDPAVPTPPPVRNRDVLLVEDHELGRAALTGYLTKRGFRVSPAVSSREAIQQAASGRFAVVLMDNIEGDEMDGIETTWQIHLEHPRTPVIFVSGSADDLDYRKRATQRHLKVSGWVPKPIPNINDLLDLVEKEALKSDLRAALTRADRSQKFSPDEYLRDLAQSDPSLSPKILEELLEELRTLGLEITDPDLPEEIYPLQESEEIPDMDAIIRKIDETYDQIRDLIAQRAGDPGLTDAVRPLREKLRTLQQEEADAIELHFRSQILFDPREGRELLKQVKKRLGRQ